MPPRRSAKFDAFFDPRTGRWLEKKCGDPACEFCRNRPPRARLGKDRPAVERLFRIASLLRTGRRFTADELGAHFEVSKKTIDRDFAFLRDRLGWVFEYEPRRRRWVLVSAPSPVL